MDEEKRPIATAPRDGTKVRLWCDDGVWRVGSFVKDDWWEIGNGAARVKGLPVADPTTLTATHWMPRKSQ